MGLIKVYQGIEEDSKSKVATHTDTFHIISEELELERYQQSDGTLTNFTTTAIVGTGTVTETAATHSIDISTGIAAAPAEAAYETADTVTLTENPWVLNFRMLSHVSGTGAGKQTQIGLIAAVQVIAFNCDNAGAWSAYVYDGATAYSKAISVSDGDLLTLRIDKYRQAFYVNGVEVWESGNGDHTVAYIVSMNVSSTSTTAARELKISNFSISNIAKPARQKKL